jgi:hypothetical protein
MEGMSVIVLQTLSLERIQGSHDVNIAVFSDGKVLVCTTNNCHSDVCHESARNSGAATVRAKCSVVGAIVNDELVPTPSNAITVFAPQGDTAVSLHPLLKISDSGSHHLLCQTYTLPQGSSACTDGNIRMTSCETISLDDGTLDMGPVVVSQMSHYGGTSVSLLSANTGAICSQQASYTAIECSAFSL